MKKVEEEKRQKEEKEQEEKQRELMCTLESKKSRVVKEHADTMLSVGKDVW